MSSAAARVSATHMATSSPTWRTLSVASAGWSETLKPGKPETARIGLTPAMSAAVKTASRIASGTSIALMRAWASGLRTKATSRMPASRMSATYCPRPVRKRSSSLRSRRAPTPFVVIWLPSNSAAPGCRHLRSILRRLQQVGLELDAIAAVDDVGDVDGDPLTIDHHAMGLRRGRVERHLQEARRLGVRTRDHQRLMGGRDLDPLHGGQDGEGRVTPEVVGRLIVDVLGEVEADERIGAGTAQLNAAQEHVLLGEATLAGHEPRLAHRRADRDELRHDAAQLVDQRGPAGVECQPAPILDALGHEGALALLAP